MRSTRGIEAGCGTRSRRLRAGNRGGFVVTENAEDFRKLAGSVELHPGLIVLPSVARNGSWRLCSITSSIWAAIDRKICS
jgi:hypothetical protein